MSVRPGTLLRAVVLALGLVPAGLLEASTLDAEPGRNVASAIAPLLSTYETPASDAGVLRRVCSRGGRLFITERGRLTPAAERLHAALQRLTDHGVEAGPYHLPALQAAVRALPAPASAREACFLLARGLLAMRRDLAGLGGAPLSERLRALTLAARDEVGMAAALSSLAPRWPEYEALVRAHRRFREAERAAREGRGAPPVPAGFRLRPGERSPLVPWLKRRLALEGFYRGPLDGEAVDHYDVPLREAVGHRRFAYGEPHRDAIGEALAAALAVPLAARRRQIARGLARWRASPLRGERSALRVNIPRFTAELYEDRRLVRRFRVVVGSDEPTFDPTTGRQGRLDRTPRLASAIDRVVLNPVWRVPPRIAEAELAPRERREPGYYDREGFLVRGSSVVQLPGPGNALGRVKFLFDNDEGVYLHDTPRKRLFRERRRAFSHGCVRLERPLDLARHLLAREGHAASGHLPALLAGEREIELTLARPLPIVIDYNTVTADEEGRVLFLEDVYRLDGGLDGEGEERGSRRRLTPPAARSGP